MAKLRVYLETSFVSYLTGGATSNVQIASAQAYTRQWWEEERAECDVFASVYTVAESAKGAAEKAKARADVLNAVNLLETDEQAKLALAQKLLDGHALPPGEVTDALHIAVASVANMDVILTWNCKHIANMYALPKTIAIIRAAGYTCPRIVTPETFITYKTMEA